MTRLKTTCAICAALCSAPLVLLGQTNDNDADLAAIRQTAKSYLDAFDQGDAKAVAAHWTEDGEYIDQTGLALLGREAIEKGFEEFFSKNNGAKLQLKIESLRLLEEDVAVEIGESALTDANGKAGDRARYKAIHVKQDGTWKIQSVHEGPPLPPSNYQHLKDLEWMIGNWVDEEVREDTQQPTLVVHTQARWSPHRNFVVRDFTATMENQVVTTGTQRIGWYSPADQIRSWAFDSDGGISVGVWSKNGDQWVVKTEQVLRDGKISSETETVTIDDLHAHNWRITNRTLDGKSLPDLMINVHRYGTKQP